MKTIKVKLSEGKSKYFPIEARFTLNKVGYSLVFENMHDVRMYFTRFYPAQVIFCEK